MEIKTPKGTADSDPVDMVVREKVFGLLKNCFRRHGAVEIDTPVFELKDILTNKYGEDSKLIYDLADQGEGESLALRYDLTVPFARYLACHGLKKMTRFHIAKVYRRDRPYMTRGRFREFYQCDFDIAGDYDMMIPDADCLKLITEIMDALEVENFQIRLSHRKLLDGFFEVCGVPNELLRPITSAVDKLDKTPWETVREEMLAKGLSEESADKIKTFVEIKGNVFETLEQLCSIEELIQNENARSALDEMRILFGYLDTFGVTDCLNFDLSLARGLDYYTGLIFEAIHLDSEQEGVRIGSICGGGRYDKLVGRFGSQDIPSVGFSVGIERILAIKKESYIQQRICTTDAFVVGIGVSIEDRMKLAQLLWESNINAEFAYKKDISGRKQFEQANKKSIPFAVVIGEEELKNNQVSVKDMHASSQIKIDRCDLVPYLLAQLNK